jgi:hypothetical protein
VDHSKLAALYPALRATLAQFGEIYPFRTIPVMVQCSVQCAVQTYSFRTIPAMVTTALKHCSAVCSVHLCSVSSVSSVQCVLCSV